MFIHFEDWSHYMGGLDKRIPNQQKAIKAYGSFTDPRDFLDDQQLFVMEVNHQPFLQDEVFQYGDSRAGYTGVGLEEDLSRAHQMSLRFKPTVPLDDIAKKTTRAMIRLAHSKDFPAAIDAMNARDLDGNWYFNHPFSLLHGFERLTRSRLRSMAIHFDILSPNSLDLLSKVFDWEDSSRLVPIREGLRLRESDISSYFPEGNPNPRERI